MSPRRPYSGISRRLVLAFDVGTTFSGVSYCILDPGHVPEIKGLTRFPYQDATGGDFKVPSIIWYDANGEVRAIGAGAVMDGIEQEAEDLQWTKVEWFKLHLRPKTLGADEVSRFAQQMPALPACKTVVDVLADYFRFLFESSRAYIESNYSTGHSIWTSVQSNIEFVLSHPNGWEGFQQSQMKQAAILAGLVPDTDEGKSRIHFVTEGEASLHFCLSRGLMVERIETDSRVLVVDAGGGTIDISSYEKQAKGEKFSELSAPECKLRGSIFVTQYARKYLEEHLRESPFLFAAPDMTRCFDKSTKLRFRQKDDPSFIKFGTFRDNDPTRNIRSGQIKLHGDVVATFFQSSVDCIVDTVLRHHRDHNIMTVFLVGGFAESGWLYDSVKAAVRERGIEVSRPLDDRPNKAVAYGAASFFIDRFVSLRVSRYSYGARASVSYNPNNPDHVARTEKRYVSTGGTEMIFDTFNVILPKGSSVKEEEEFRRPYHRLATNKTEFSSVTEKVYRYRGALQSPEWIDEDEDNFEVMCTIESKFPNSSAAFARRQGKSGVYFAFDYETILLFGLTEFKAQIAWKEKGVEKRSPARVIYEDLS